MGNESSKLFFKTFLSNGAYLNVQTKFQLPSLTIDTLMVGRLAGWVALMTQMAIANGLCPQVRFAVNIKAVNGPKMLFEKRNINYLLFALNEKSDSIKLCILFVFLFFFHSLIIICMYYNVLFIQIGSEVLPI